MFAGVAGWFAAGAEEALLSGSGARTSCEASGHGFAGCSILASICGTAGGGLEGVCCGVFLTGGILTSVAGKGFFAAFAGRGECFGGGPIILSTSSTDRGSTTGACGCVLLADGLAAFGVVVTGGGVTRFIASLNTGVF